MDFSTLIADIEADARQALTALEDDAKAIEQKVAPIVKADFVAFGTKFRTLAVTTFVSFLKSGVAAVEAKGMTTTVVVQAAEIALGGMTGQLIPMALALIEQVALGVATTLGAAPAAASS